MPDRCRLSGAVLSEKSRIRSFLTQKTNQRLLFHRHNPLSDGIPRLRFCRFAFSLPYCFPHISFSKAFITDSLKHFNPAFKFNGHLFYRQRRICTIFSLTDTPPPSTISSGRSVSDLHPPETMTSQFLDSKLQTTSPSSD